MRPSSGSRVFVCAVVFLGSFAATMALTSTAPQGAVDAGATFMDRSLKGDRLPATRDLGTPRVRSNPKLPDGCVEVHAGPKSIYTAEIAGRCLV